MRSIFRRITIPIRVVSRRTFRRAILHPRRLRVLPHIRELYSAVGRRRWRALENTPRRGAALVIADEEHIDFDRELRADLLISCGDVSDSFIMRVAEMTLCPSLSASRIAFR